MRSFAYGTFPVTYPAAARYFDIEGTCQLKDEMCDGPVKVHAYFFAPLPANEPTTMVELIFTDDAEEDVIELCAIHHGQWWERQYEEFRAKAKRLSADEPTTDEPTNLR